MAGLAISAFMGWWLDRLLFAMLRRLPRVTVASMPESFLRHLETPSRLLTPLVLMSMTLPALVVRAQLRRVLGHLLGLGVIVALAWMTIALIDVLEDFIGRRYRTDVADNLAARQIRTQMQMLRRIGVVMISVGALSFGLMTFSSIRRLGTTLFASAGVAGIVVGMAARPTLSSIIAGVQIALTEPIRLDDVVIVEGEWGWIEEIRTTYVVVRIWDLRRLVVPLSYFIEKPFQNWTRVTADLLGTVFIYCDYTLPVEELRQQLRRVLESTPLWDGKVCGVQVTDTTEHTMQIRALMSASDSGKAWDLRCYVREQLIAWLQQTYPHCLPTLRAELSAAAGSPAGELSIGRRLPGSAQAGAPS